MLPKDQAALAVALDRYNGGSPVPHVELLPHHLAYKGRSCLQPSIFSDCFLHLLGASDRFVDHEHSGHNGFDGLPLRNLLQLSLSEALQLFGFPLRLSSKVTDKLSRHSKLLGYLFLHLKGLLCESDDGHDFIGTQVLTVALLQTGPRRLLCIPLLPKIVLGPTVDVVHWFGSLFSKASSARFGYRLSRGLPVLVLLSPLYNARSDHDGSLSP